jgi:hypothetical protein
MQNRGKDKINDRATVLYGKERTLKKELREWIKQIKQLRDANVYARGIWKS